MPGAPAPQKGSVPPGFYLMGPTDSGERYEAETPISVRPLESTLIPITALLGAFSGIMALLRTGLVGPGVLVGYSIVIILGVVFVFGARAYIEEFFRDLNAAERIGLGILALAGAAAPSILLKTWAPLTGLAVLIIAQVPGLINPAGFARYSLVCGLAIALATSRLPTHLSLPALATFCTLLILMHTVEAWYFAVLRRVRRSRGIVPPVPDKARILKTALQRIGWATLLVVPLGVLTSFFKFEMLPDTRDLPGRVNRLGMELDLSFLTLLIHSMLIACGAICLALLYRWLEKFRRSTATAEENANLEAEVETVILGSAPRAQRAARSSRTPVRMVMDLYEQLCRDMASFGAGRLPAETPLEWSAARNIAAQESKSVTEANGTGNDQVTDLATSTSQRIAELVIRARYSGSTITMADVKTFRQACADFSKHWRNANAPNAGK